MVCLGCGVWSGGGVRVVLGHHPSNPILRFLAQLKHRRQKAWLADSLRTHDQFVDSDKRLILARIIAEVPFPVYGLLGRPIGLRLRSPGYGSLNGRISKISLGYVSGDPTEPNKAIELEQFTGDGYLHHESGISNLMKITSLIANYSPRGRSETGPFQGDFHKDWNIERIESTPRQQATVRVNGTDVEARFISWDTPHRVILARLTIGTNPLLVSALNVSWDDLREALSSLTVLGDDQKTLTGHQQDFDESSRLLKENLLNKYQQDHP